MLSNYVLAVELSEDSCYYCCCICTMGINEYTFTVVLRYSTDCLRKIFHSGSLIMYYPSLVNDWSWR